MRARGTSNANARGNSEDRRRRREWLLSTFGDGSSCPCSVCGTALTAETVTVDRVVPGAEGGRYVRGNIRPMCAGCNSETGGRLGAQRKTAA
jgi:hypothetical protein